MLNELISEIFKEFRVLHWFCFALDHIGLKDLPLIHSYDSIQALSKDIGKSERGHDLVIAVSLFFWIIHVYFLEL